MVDRLVDWCYNYNMNLEKPTRKKRVDRTHIIYELRVNGQNYIGVTAKTESKNWLLCEELRKLANKNEIEVLVHETIRGKAAAHKREVELRRIIKPALNTDVRGD